MTNLSRFSALLLASAAVLLICAPACDKEKEEAASANTSSAPTSAAVPVATTTTRSDDPSTVTPTTTTKETTGGKLAVTWKGVGLSTPESVLHDPDADVYLVSNVDGQPLEVDGKGFISRLGPDGSVPTPKWIESGKNKVTLNAPKGMAFVDDRLYVADIDTVRIFDRKTGMPMGEVKVPGATYLNDVAATPDGRVVVTDTGMKMVGKKTEPSGTDAVYAIDKDKKLSTISKSKDLGGPNGILATGDKMWVVSTGSGELYSLDAKGKRDNITKLPKGTLDGIVMLGTADFLVSSWDASAVYRVKPAGEAKMVIEDVKSPADISYDKKRSRVLVPLFNENEVRAYDLK
jgi:hypothetical protein